VALRRIAFLAVLVLVARLMTMLVSTIRVHWRRTGVSL
jgi:hypothetical protein